MGRITVLTNPMNTCEARTYEHSGPFIDFLLRKFPSGFPGPHVTLIGMDRLAVEDYDRTIVDGDVVTISVAPATPAAAVIVGRIILGIVIAQALNYVISHFFGPKASKPTQPKVLAELPAASPTYNLNTPTNVARIGQPIPVAYGRNLIVPDLAAPPYSWFINNEMYIGMYLCLGQGRFTIHSVKLANTAVDDMIPGVVSYSVYNSGAHRQTFGVMQAATGLYENMYTSPEVSDQELLGGGSSGLYAFTSPVTLWNGFWDTERGEYTGAIFYFDIEALSHLELFKSGAPIWVEISNSDSCDGTYQVWHIAGVAFNPGLGEPYPPDYAKKGHLAGGVTWPVDSDEGTATLRIADPSSPDPSTAVGPFAVTPVGATTALLCYDLVFPGGCYAVDSTTGNLLSFAVSAEFRAEEIDDSGNVVPGGNTSTYQYAESFATTTLQRRTLYHNVPNGRYRVKGFRTSDKSSQASDRSDLIWTGLKAVLGNTMGDTVYGDTTILAMQVKATQGVASDVASRVSVDCTRELNGVATRNPADAFTDILTNTIYGGRRPSAELDTATIEALKTQWATAGKTFDAVYDQDTTLWEALGLSVQMQHAFPTVVGSMVSIVEDKNHILPSMSLSEDTIVKITKQTMFTDGEEPDGVEGEYRDPGDGAALYAIYPPDAVKPESVTLWGCRDYATALAYVTQRWKQLSLRRCLVSVEVEGEGHVIPVGTPVHVTHSLLGPDPVLCIVNSVTANDEFSTTIEMHRHVPEVFT